jgi:hypothetical protein
MPLYQALAQPHSDINIQIPPAHGNVEALSFLRGLGRWSASPRAWGFRFFSWGIVKPHVSGAGNEAPTEPEFLRLFKDGEKQTEMMRYLR